jgi:hypothetical protein
LDKAIARIEKAISNKEKILVYGDYDVDGTTAVALVYTFLKNLPDLADKSQIAYYIPDRYKEGYGISFAGIDYAKENNFSLIIALDCGIKSIDKVDYANKQNIDFIICDHHYPGDIIPDAVAVLDLFQHLLDVGAGKLMPRRRAEAFELALHAPGWRLAQGFAQGTPHPLGKRQRLLLRRRLHAAQLRLIDQHLHTLAHGRGLSDSPR